MKKSEIDMEYLKSENRLYTYIFNEKKEKK